MSGPRIGVVGATGAVGREVLKILEERSFDLAELRPIASRADGRVITYRGEEIPVVAISEDAFADLDIAIWDTPDEVARDWVPRVRDRVLSIDNSAQFRLLADVPLVIPEINPEAAATHTGMIANPNCTMMTLILPLAPLHKEFGAVRVIASSYQSTSGGGAAGPVELYSQLDESAGQRDTLATGKLKVSDPTVFTHPIAYNVIPRVGSFDEAGTTSEERRVSLETNKVLGSSIDIFATAVRVPTVVGHGISAWVEFGQEVSEQDARRVLSEALGVVVEDEPSSNRYPTTLQSAGLDKAVVGRIRRDPANPRALGFFSCCDNLRKGAALNTVQIAELVTR